MLILNDWTNFLNYLRYFPFRFADMIFFKKDTFCVQSNLSMNTHSVNYSIIAGDKPMHHFIRAQPTPPRSERIDKAAE